jgi:hypothetical protein
VMRIEDMILLNWKIILLNICRFGNCFSFFKVLNILNKVGYLI